MPTSTSIAQRIKQLQSAACLIKCENAKQTSSWLNERLIENDFERVIVCDLDDRSTVQNISFRLTEAIATTAFALWPNWFEDQYQQSESAIDQSIDRLIATWERRLKSSETLIRRKWLQTADRRCREGLIPLFANDSLTRQLRNLSRCIAVQSLAVLIRINTAEHDPSTLPALSKVCEWFAAESNSSTVLIVESAANLPGLEALPEVRLPELPELQVEARPTWPPKHLLTNEHVGNHDDSTDQAIKPDPNIPHQAKATHAPPAAPVTPTDQSPPRPFALEHTVYERLVENQNTTHKKPLPHKMLTDDWESQDKVHSEETRQSFGPFIGRPHPGSPGEQRMAEALQKDTDLAALFEFNQRITANTGNRFIVDLIWKAGQVIVEIDGYSYHSNRAIFHSDRQRDYELMLSDYKVLRITHSEVMFNLPSTVEKIRNVVSWRRDQISQGEFDAD